MYLLSWRRGDGAILGRDGKWQFIRGSIELPLEDGVPYTILSDVGVFSVRDRAIRPVYSTEAYTDLRHDVAMCLKMAKTVIVRGADVFAKGEIYLRKVPAYLVDMLVKDGAIDAHGNVIDIYAPSCDTLIQFVRNVNKPKEFKKCLTQCISSLRSPIATAQVRIIW